MPGNLERVALELRQVDVDMGHAERHIHFRKDGVHLALFHHVARHKVDAALVDAAQLSLIIVNLHDAPRCAVPPPTPLGWCA
jgi:hypothetical protein